jgi:hypothetical protein
MLMRRLSTRVAVLATTTLAIPALLAAQDRTTEFRGRGSLDLPGVARVDLVKGRLELKQNGTFELEVWGSRQFQNWKIKGQYQGGAWDRRVELRVTDGIGDDARTGDGRVEFDQFNAVRGVAVEGRSNRGTWTVRFTGDGSGAQQPPPPPAGGRDDDDDWNRPDDGPWLAPADFQLDRTRNSVGIVRTRFEDDQLDRLRLQLRRDGTAELRANGSRTWTVRARWRFDRSNRVELDVIEAFGRRVDGSGTVTIARNGRDFDRVTVRIRTRGDEAELRFDADGGFGGGPGGGLGGNVPESYSRSFRVNGSVTDPVRGRLDVRQVQVQLDRNGTARLRLRAELDRGNDWIEIRGTWREGRSGEALVDVRELNGRRADGTASVSFFRGRDAQDVRGLVRTNGGRLTFRATRR